MTDLLMRDDALTTYVRPLLFRESWYIVPTSTLAAFLASQLVNEQFKHPVEDTVRWTMAIFNVTPASGGVAPRPIDEIAALIDDLIDDRVGEQHIPLRTAVEAVNRTLTSIYGQQVRITGWLPGHRVAEGRAVLVLDGNNCPKCTINPTGHRAGDTAHTARCLNSEDCGWING